MTTCYARKGKSLSLCAALAALLVAGFVLAPAGVLAATVQIDLDSTTAGVQSALNLPASPNTAVITGSVVVTGNSDETIGSNVTQVDVTDNPGGSITLNPANSSLTNGDLAAAIPATGTVSPNDFIWINTFPVAADIGPDGVLVLFNFSLELTNLSSKADGDVYNFTFRDSADNVTLGIVVDGTNASYGPGGENPPIAVVEAAITIGGGNGPTPTATVPVATATPTEVGDPTPTATQGETRCRDTGYYVLTSYGDHIQVGNAPEVTGSVSTPGVKNFGDMEVVDEFLVPGKGPGTLVQDLAIMDRFGVVTFVQTNNQPASEFILTEPFPCGPAVDVIVSVDGNGFWVLTEGGGIYRGGDAKPAADPALLGNDADDNCGIFPLPFGDLRAPAFGSAGDGATIRAVGFVVIQNLLTKGTLNDTPTGYIVMDSQGGTYLFDGAGNSIRDAAGNTGSGAAGTGILDPNTVYPFFPGLDIARDIELTTYDDLLPAKGGAVPNPDGLAIYDGWGGTHPVPVDDPSSSVFFITNDDGSGNQLTTVGLPYLIAAFDDPDTVGDEGAGALDVNSIFVDLEFCQSNPSGLYVMDKFGGVFAFGNTRPNPNSTAPIFSSSPYFFPALLAEDMEPFSETTFLMTAE